MLKWSAPHNVKVRCSNGVYKYDMCQSGAPPCLFWDKAIPQKQLSDAEAALPETILPEKRGEPGVLFNTVLIFPKACPVLS